MIIANGPLPSVASPGPLIFTQWFALACGMILMAEAVYLGMLFRAGKPLHWRHKLTWIAVDAGLLAVAFGVGARIVYERLHAATPAVQSEFVQQYNDWARSVDQANAIFGMGALVLLLVTVALMMGGVLVTAIER